MALLNIGLNTVSKGEQIPDIEWINHIINERVRATYKKINRNLTKITGVIIN